MNSNETHLCNRTDLLSFFIAVGCRIPALQTILSVSRHCLRVLAGVAVGLLVLCSEEMKGELRVLRSPRFLRTAHGLSLKTSLGDRIERKTASTTTLNNGVHASVLNLPGNLKSFDALEINRSNRCNTSENYPSKN